MEGLEPSLFETLTAVNIEAVYYACRTVWPIMRKQARGIIINLSSIASVEAFDGFAAYGASKAWVNAWTRGLAEEGKALGIRVFAVAPGAVETKMLRDTFPDFPRGQALDPSEVAELVFWLTHPGCQYSSGQTVFIKK
jgi:NAD(P)-dependent dehydrogenase (short-subunit alcohol dehydrogenase family)